MSTVQRAASAIDWEVRVRDLWAFVDDVRSMGFSLDPRDVLDNLAAVWRLVNEAWDLVAEPPPGAPGAVRAAAEAWLALQASLDEASDSLTAQAAVVHDTWTGAAADACRVSIRELGRSLDDAAGLADLARRALESYADELVAARSRHAQVGENLRSAGGRIRTCAPWEVPGMVRGLVGDVCAAVHAAIDAYSGATEAARVCEHALDVVNDQMPFPDGVVGLTSVALINLSDASGRDTRPLVGDTTRRAQEAYDALPPADRETVDALLDGAPGSQHRAWVLAALAGGTGTATLGRFADRIAVLDADALAASLDPTDSSVTSQRTVDGVRVLQQSTSTTCGSASLIVARMLSDPVYALWMLDGYDAASGEEAPGGSTPDGIAQRFGREELVVQRRTNSSTDRSSRIVLPPIIGTKVPWPSALGTPPWGASEEMNNGAGVPGTGYHVSMIDSDSRAEAQRAYDEVARSVDSGRPVPMYTGSDNAPRHVVLVVGRDADGGLQMFNPATGRVSRVSESGFVAGGAELEHAGSWPRGWAVITP